MSSAGLDLRFPHSHDRIPVPSQVGVAANVAGALGDSMRGRVWEAGRVGVPVVAVNLDHKPRIFDDEIANPPADSHLPRVIDSGRCHPFADGALRPADEPTAGRVPIVQRHVGALNRAVASLPLSDATLNAPEVLAAHGARSGFPGAPMGMAASGRTEALASRAGRLKRLSALLAWARLASAGNALARARAVHPAPIGGFGRLDPIRRRAYRACSRFATPPRWQFGRLASAPAGTSQRAKPLLVLSAAVHEFRPAPLANLRT